MIFSSPKNRIILFLVIALLILMGTATLIILKNPLEPGRPDTLIDTSYIKGAAGLTGDFTLTNENGVTVTPESYAGQYKIIFFGFTHCPSICPTELLKIADILSALPAPLATRITPLFITVDPTRDTAEILKKYTDNFDPRIIGLTGTPAQIQAAINAFKIYAARVDTSPHDYTFDHSTFLYLFGPGHDLIKLYRMNDTAEIISADLKLLVR